MQFFTSNGTMNLPRSFGFLCVNSGADGSRWQQWCQCEMTRNSSIATDAGILWYLLADIGVPWGPSGPDLPFALFGGYPTGELGSGLGPKELLTPGSGKMHDLKGMEAQPPQRARYFHSSLRDGYRPHPGIGQKWTEKGALIGLTKADWGQTWPSLAFKLGRSWGLAEVEQWGPMLRPCWIEPVNLADVVPICNLFKLHEITRAGNLFLVRGHPANTGPPTAEAAPD